MRRQIFIVLAVIIFAVFAHAQGTFQGRGGPVQLTLGKFEHNVFDAPTIVFEVKNGTGRLLTWVTVECGFYSADNNLIAADHALLRNILPNEVGVGHSSATPTARDAVSARCRIEGVEYN
jgi:hypothetical protein